MLWFQVWEIKQRTLIDMAADRGAYIDQSQSFNVFIADPNFAKLTSLQPECPLERMGAWSDR